MSTTIIIVSSFGLIQKVIFEEVLYIHRSWVIGLINISFTFTWFGACTANTMAFAISTACSASICFVLSTYFSNALSVIVLISSVATTPGSIHVIRMLDR
jgi:hypothetical protein